MDTLYLLRFNKNSSLQELEDEQRDLYQTIKSLERVIIDLDPLAVYSQVAAAMKKLASAKAKKSYIDRLISIAEQNANRLNPELNCRVKSGSTSSPKALFPDNYYGDYPS